MWIIVYSQKFNCFKQASLSELTVYKFVDLAKVFLTVHCGSIDSVQDLLTDQEVLINVECTCVTSTVP